MKQKILAGLLVITIVLSFLPSFVGPQDVYASSGLANSGPSFTDVRLSKDAIIVECSPCVAISCFTSTGTQTASGTSTAPIQKATFSLSENDHWVRVEIKDKYDLRAWTNPMVPF